MATPANQSGTHSGSVTPKKTAKKTAPKTTPKAASKPKATGTYSWNGGPATHHISQDQHAANQIAVGAGLPRGAIPTNLTDPLTTAGAYGLATAQAQAQYAPQIQANQTLQNSSPAWFNNYVAQNQVLRSGLAANAQPALNNANAAVTNQAPTAGLDPNSQVGMADAQAAKGRAALAQLGADSLQGVVSAGDAYLAGMQGVAIRDQPQVQAQLVQQGGQLKSQQGYQAATNFNTLRTGEQNYGLAQATLGSNIANQTTDNAIASQNANTQASSVAGTQAAAKAKQKAAAETPNQYGVKPSQWNTWSTSHRQRVIDASKKTAGNTQGAKDTAKKQAAIQKATGSLQSKVSDAQSDFKRYSRMTNTVTDPVTKKATTVKPTPDQVVSKMRKDGYTNAEIDAARTLMTPGARLTGAQIQALKHQDPNIRIPNSWRPARNGAITDTTPSNTINHGGHD